LDLGTTRARLRDSLTTARGLFERSAGEFGRAGAFDTFVERHRARTRTAAKFGLSALHLARRGGVAYDVTWYGGGRVNICSDGQ
jgi:hypothetical protein